MMAILSVRKLWYRQKIILTIYTSVALNLDRFSRNENIKAGTVIQVICYEKHWLMSKYFFTENLLPRVIVIVVNK